MNRQYLGIEISDLFFLTPSIKASAALPALIEPKKPGTWKKFDQQFAVSKLASLLTLSLMSFSRFSDTMNG
jgi:hypothetical protein